MYIDKGLSRLKAANYSNPGSELFSVSYLYDKHGNITSLSRKGLKMSGSYGDIDILSLNYGGSNRLKYINDYGETVMLNTSCDFKNYSTGTDEYAYNANGAMTKNLNRGISEMTYNVLNLPAKVDVKSPVAEARNEYGVLKRILTENGYYESGNYYFYIQNHLGSNVITINKNGSIVQSSHYYPFGLTLGISTGQGVQPYKYTGKELDMQHGLNLYDFSARTYDPAIGRFTTVDPLAEKYYPVSPYAYCANNPVNAVDLDGMDYYYISERGHIVFALETDDEFDRICAFKTDENGHTTASTVDIKDQGLLPQLTGGLENGGHFDVHSHPGTADYTKTASGYDLYFNGLKNGGSDAEYMNTYFNAAKAANKKWPSEYPKLFIYHKETSILYNYNHKSSSIYAGKVTTPLSIRRLINNYKIKP